MLDYTSEQFPAMIAKCFFLALSGLFTVLNLGLTQRIQASSAEYSAQGNYLLTSTLARLPAGDVVELGTFTASFNFAANKSNYTTTNAAFTLYSTATIGTNGSVAGQFDAITGNLDTTTAAGKQLFIWVFNSATPSTASGWAIITDTTDTNWVGPAVGTNSTAIDTSNTNIFIPAGALGSIATDTTAPSGKNFSVAVGAVPEPSAYALIAIAGCTVFVVCATKRRA